MDTNLTNLYVMTLYAGEAGVVRKVFRKKSVLKREFNTWIDDLNDDDNIHVQSTYANNLDPSAKTVYGILFINEYYALGCVGWLSGSYEEVEKHFLNITGKENADVPIAEIDDSILYLSKFNLY